jgi:hypothetical protein
MSLASELIAAPPEPPPHAANINENVKQNNTGMHRNARLNPGLYRGGILGSS